MTPKETVEGIYAAFGRGDIAHIVGQVAEGALWRQPSVPWGGDYFGPEGAAHFFRRLDELVETTGFEIDENIEAPNQIISYGFYASRNRATGKEARVRFVFRWQFEGSKVSRYEAVLDSAPVMDAAR